MVCICWPKFGSETLIKLIVIKCWMFINSTGSDSKLSKFKIKLNPVWPLELCESNFLHLTVWPDVSLTKALMYCRYNWRSLEKGSIVYGNKLKDKKNRLLGHTGCSFTLMIMQFCATLTFFALMFLLPSK